jgi:hypothetical protein
VTLCVRQAPNILAAEHTYSLAAAHTYILAAAHTYSLAAAHTYSLVAAHTGRALPPWARGTQPMEALLSSGAQAPCSPRPCRLPPRACAPRASAGITHGVSRGLPADRQQMAHDEDPVMTHVLIIMGALIIIRRLMRVIIRHLMSGTMAASRPLPALVSRSACAHTPSGPHGLHRRHAAQL